MVPEDEGKAAPMSGRMVEVRQEDIQELEDCLTKIEAHIDNICASDLLSMLSTDENRESQQFPQNYKYADAARSLASKQDEVKLLNKYALLKVRNILPRNKGTSEEAHSNLSLKQSRPLSPSHVARFPGMANSLLNMKLGELDLPETADVSMGPPIASSFDLASPSSDRVPLKYIKMGDNTKAPYQKPPSTIYMPTAKHAVNMQVETPGELALPGGICKPTPIGSKSPKKRSGRSRRDRSRARNKVVITPEPVMQRLLPGDNNKIPEDGYLWRKYGNKPIKTASYKRGYYKCRHFKDSEVKCNATKIVQQTNNDPGTFSVLYKGEHTCKKPNGLGSGRGQLGAGGPDAITVSLADQIIHDNGMDDKDLDKDELIDGGWPSGANSSDSASDDMFATSEVGDDAVESAPTTLGPQSPLIDFDMTSIGSNSHEKIHSIGDSDLQTWSDTVAAVGSDVFQKAKYEPIETCPPEAQELDSGFHEDNQLLKIIGGGIWDSPSDVNWYHDQFTNDFYGF